VDRTSLGRRSSVDALATVMEEDGDGDLQGEGDAILHGNQQQSSKFRGVTWNKSVSHHLYRSGRHIGLVLVLFVQRCSVRCLTS
jgi:hypothetical protein